ncbi:division/cell wall cluster transcriptional repressor MraZ [Roseobacter sp. HKCCA0434]|uniref:division/cell wall cluster transcriptional repressor MraZ n=1 Tax=Roseobacter sp. HKCCA0434 TaxID=3079297 RepID=UPI002905A6C2|nr:division/cell wall cluster transcriptional repressor MraZ [Roseobacter sp. HKCCA0434]
MAQRFRGEWTHKVDAKGRVSVPAPFRRVLESVQGWQSGDPVQLVVVLDQDERPCLNVYTTDEIDQIDDLIASLPRFAREREALSTRLASGAEHVTLDENGRFGLTKEMRAKAGIEGQAVFAGLIDSFQIWSPEGYEEKKARMADWIKEERDPNDLFELLYAAQQKYLG